MFEENLKRGVPSEGSSASMRIHGRHPRASNASTRSSENVRPCHRDWIMDKPLHMQQGCWPTLAHPCRTFWSFHRRRQPMIEEFHSSYSEGSHGITNFPGLATSCHPAGTTISCHPVQAGLSNCSPPLIGAGQLSSRLYVAATCNVSPADKM